MGEARTRTDRPVLDRLATAVEPDGMPVLVAAAALGRLSAGSVGATLARGFSESGLAAPDVLELSHAGAPAPLQVLLEHERFDVRLHRARCLVITAAELDERTLAASAAFELATRARQGGVPAYAIAGRCEVGAFDARMLDLQLVLQARTERTLASAARRLSALLRGPASAGSRGTRR